MKDDNNKVITSYDNLTTYVSILKLLDYNLSKEVRSLDGQKKSNEILINTIEKYEDDRLIELKNFKRIKELDKKPTDLKFAQYEEKIKINDSIILTYQITNHTPEEVGIKVIMILRTKYKEFSNFSKVKCWKEGKIIKILVKFETNNIFLINKFTEKDFIINNKIRPSIDYVESDKYDWSEKKDSLYDKIIHNVYN